MAKKFSHHVNIDTPSTDESGSSEQQIGVVQYEMIINND